MSTRSPFFRKKFPLRLLAGVLLLVILGCRGERQADDSGLSMALAISPTPPGVGPARLIITLQDSAGAPVEGATVEVEGNMTHAGMVPVLGAAVAGEPGVYTVPDFRFTMAGDWILTLRASLPDGRAAELRRGTKVYSAPPGISGDTGDTSLEDPPPDSAVTGARSGDSGGAT